MSMHSVNPAAPCLRLCCNLISQRSCPDLILSCWRATSYVCQARCLAAGCAAADLADLRTMDGVSAN